MEQHQQSLQKRLAQPPRTSLPRKTILEAYGVSTLAEAYPNGAVELTEVDACRCVMCGVPVALNQDGDLTCLYNHVLSETHVQAFEAATNVSVDRTCIEQGRQARQGSRKKRSRESEAEGSAAEPSQ